ncbi:hypothetical protein GCM10010112_36300 [Actinoplanes lobatus]|uniref:Anti-sigma factor antagonist n=1 Tax=Actinoplanes lobatus TaxID=113568 RepID=A0A7W7HDL4_9ACTN|nr:STAS domain-containing protein [Actinoplanes lobatus]MBB4748192.1 anti-sigma B factor antagonist [Actinoplanes lobatus]GGN70125.1 hypothetical protein GCM10010112_36300 [Actinoplanes lobatus]GIE40042.1 hypothetical protein Alo02nite_29400 [Actinoplanes lobatus]
MENSIRTTRTDDGSVTVTVLGEVDFANSDMVAQGIHDAITDWSPTAVRVDLRDAAFIDSTGLGALIEGYRTAEAKGVTFEVLNPSDTFRRVLSVTGLSDFFGLIDDRDEEPSRASGA